MRQLSLPIPNTHGGRRKGAGRPNRSGKLAHSRRERLDPRHPVHVTLKLREGLPSLRRKEVFKCLRDAVRVARKKGFAVAHFAILSNHVHLILEPKENGVSTLLRSLSISFARRLNREMKRNGAVFHDRYHVHILKTPTEVRRALIYVLTNDAKHRSVLEIRIDPFTSGWAFRDWKALLRGRAKFEHTQWPESYVEAWHSEILKPPKTWLLREGWRRAA